MRVKSFTEFLNEEEKAAPEAELENTEKTEEKPVVKTEEKPEEKPEVEPKTKDQRLGYMADGKEIMSKMKVGHTIELTPDDFTRLQNMRVTQYERDMYDHERGGKDYKIKKDAEGKCTIFHYNKTIHELTPVGVFMLPKAEA